jgi:hypothetical protein
MTAGLRTPGFRHRPTQHILNRRRPAPADFSDHILVRDRRERLPQIPPYLQLGHLEHFRQRADHVGGRFVLGAFVGGDAFLPDTRPAGELRSRPVTPLPFGAEPSGTRS